MPATNYTPIQLYRSTTSGNQPSAANMNPGELALNIADNDMSLWMENASGVVKRVFNNPAALKYPTSDGAANQLIVTDGSGTLSFASPAGGALTNNVLQAVTSSATTTLNLNSGNVINLTMAANITTLSFTNVPASGTPILVQIVVKNASDGTAYSIVWPNSVYWSGQYAAATIGTVQTAPTLATGANGVTVISLLTTDGGTKWRGWIDATIPGGALLGLYMWGSNNRGQLGQNDLTNRSSPTQVGALTNWSQASGGEGHTLAVKTDGTLWSWGRNAEGQLGLGDKVYRSSPVQVGALTSWAFVNGTLRNFSSFAIKTDGTLWSWGDNSGGVLGQNNLVSLSSPVQVGALTNWLSMSSGSQAALAHKTDGTIWSWGVNTYGQLGQNDVISRSSPVQVGALTTWSSISAQGINCFAIKTDGTLWAWGRNLQGNLGLNDRVARSSPVQVGALTDWSVISNMNQTFGIKTNGTLWSWGLNGDGNLGQNDRTNRSSPTQVGALTNWSTVSSGADSTGFIKTDGTLWTVGPNSLGSLGDNSATNRSSPVQIGALTSWVKIYSGFNGMAALGGTVINPA
jgi:alpha-tubulin suppressor-like RCC1 family protein